MCDDDIHPRRVRAPSRREAIAWSVGVAMTAGTAGAAPGLEVVARDVEVTTPDGRADAAMFHPRGEGRWPAVLIWTDVLSLREAFRMIGRRLAAAGHVVLVPNVYYRRKRAPVVAADFDFGAPGAWDTITALSTGLNAAGALARDATAYLAFLDAQPQTDRGRRAGVQGYCMGGAIALRTAEANPERIGAAASFHGAGLVSDRPNSLHWAIPAMRAEVLIAIARDDDARAPSEKDALRTAVATAPNPGTVEVYPADHGWCVPGFDSFDEAAAERAWSALVALYTRRLA